MMPMAVTKMGAMVTSGNVHTVTAISGGSMIFLGEGTTPKVGVLTYYFAIFCRKLHENEIIWNRGRPVTPALDPPMAMANKKNLILFVVAVAV